MSEIFGEIINRSVFIYLRNLNCKFKRKHTSLKFCLISFMQKIFNYKEIG